MMTDPLSSFDWSTLHSRYDAACKGFDHASVYLSAFDSSRPRTDRELYYKLIDSLSEGKRTSHVEPIQIYEALLYWKLYSQRVTNSNLQRWLRQDISNRQRIQEKVSRLFKSLPTRLEKRTEAVVDAVRSLGTHQIPGMGKSKSAALPVRTTLLHFIYPSVVPVFDKMVLKAVDLWFEDANKKIDVLESYLPVAWELAERYSPIMPRFPDEGPIRGERQLS